jgi:hypothetical protein
MQETGAGFSVEPAESWYQGRTLFGGLVGAFAVEAAQRSVRDLPPLLSAQFTLIGPASGKLEVRPQVLRTGRSTTFVGIDVISGTNVAMRAVLTFGRARPSRHALNLFDVRHTTGPADGVPLFEAPGAPRNTVNFEGRLVGGCAPFSGGREAVLEMWLRHRDVKPVSPAVSLIALADATPPAVFSLFSAPAPISTATWSVDFCATEFDPIGWFYARTSSGFVQDGYSLQTTVMSNPEGHPVLVSHQLVALYD